MNDDQLARSINVPELISLLAMAYEMSLWVASIHWDGKPNQPEWLEELAAKVEAFQIAAQKVIRPSGMPVAR